MKNKMIYVVDDEQNIRDLIKTYLQKDGYDVEVFADAREALECHLRRPADMMVIDIMMPGMDGYTLCRELRKNGEVPIIMVSAKDDEIDRIIGLELGGDDYISKPFSPRELVARVKTIFRRIKDEPAIKVEKLPNEIKCHDIIIFPDERMVVKGNVRIEFTAKEYDFLFFLVKNKNRVFNREQLIENIWGYEYIGDTRSVDDLVKRIRRKLNEANSAVEIETVWGYGYKIKE
jgi:DNA-binding response OmpR family regulator